MVPGGIDPALTEELTRLKLIPAALVPEDKLIDEYDLELKSLLDLPDNSLAVTAVDKLMTEIIGPN